MTIEAILEDISALSLDEKEIISELIKRRIIEEKRESIYNEYRNAMNDYKKGNVQEGNIKDLLKGI